MKMNLNNFLDPKIIFKPFVFKLQLFLAVEMLIKIRYGYKKSFARNKI
jgi:hypothetical protein